MNRERVRDGESVLPEPEGGGALDVDHLSVQYGSGPSAIVAVNDVSITIGFGEKRGLVGESGSGKTTLARAIPGLVGRGGSVSAGRVMVAGQNLAAMSERARARVRRHAVSVVFQDPLNCLDPVRSIYSQVAEAVRLRRPAASSFGRKQMRAAVQALLEEAEISNAGTVMQQYPHELSGGMRQRVAIGMAVAGETRLIIADEPTTALDVVTQAEILTLLDRVVTDRRSSLLFITHNLAVVNEFCDTISVMYGGRVVEEGLCRDVVSGPKHPYTEGLIAAIPRISGGRQRLTGIPGEPPNLGDREVGCRFEPRCPLGHGVDVCRTSVPTLEEVPGLADRRRVRCHLVTRPSGDEVAHGDT